MGRLCRQYYQHKLSGDPPNCRRGSKCPLVHPPEITSQWTQEYHREIGKCYCGSSLRTIIRSFRGSSIPIRSESDSEFMRVCGRTGKAIRRCRR